jgi:hypothetical protein
MKIVRKKRRTKNVRDISLTLLFIISDKSLLYVVYTYVTVTLTSPAVASKCSRFALISNSVEPE